MYIKPSDMLREAAFLIDTEQADYACKALNMASFPYVNAEAVAYSYLVLLKPRNKQRYNAWFGDWRPKENRNRRVIALLFAAAMAEADGK